jgi:hypothetical protein
VLAPQDGITLPTDVDWSVLAARSISAADASGQEHHASRRQLAAIQDDLRRLIDRRDRTRRRAISSSALPISHFDVLILGLGFFMLMWVIATS